MTLISAIIEEHLRPLLGLKLSIGRLAADMRCFHFDEIRPALGSRGGTVGQDAIHIQCPWRIEGPVGIVTGRSDLWEPADASKKIDWDQWSYDKNPNLQDKLI